MVVCFGFAFPSIFEGIRLGKAAGKSMSYVMCRHSVTRKSMCEEHGGFLQ